MYYYFKSLEKVTAGVLDLFNDLYIRQEKYDNDTSEWAVSNYLVPLEIGTKDNIVKSYEYNYQLDGGPKRMYTVPRMAMILTDVQKDIQRQTNQLNFVKSNMYTDDDNLIQKYTRNPAWWTANYTLSIITRRMDDMAQIVEQIFPQFQPHLPLNILLIPELDLRITLPVTIEAGLSFDVDDQINDGELRFINSELQISVSVPFFPPVTDAKIIKTIYTRFAALQGYDVGEWPDSDFDSFQEEFISFAEKIDENDNLVLSSDITETIV